MAQLHAEIDNMVNQQMGDNDRHMEKVRADLKNGISPSSTVPSVVINRPHVINGPCVLRDLIYILPISGLLPLIKIL